MWGSTALKKRERPANDQAPASAPPRSRDSVDRPADRVRSLLAAFGCGHLRARAQGKHILIERDGASVGRAAVARLTAVGDDAFGLAFQEKEGGWEPMLLVDTLDAIVAGVTAVRATTHQDSAIY
jgi:hypothetical protein